MVPPESLENAEARSLLQSMQEELDKWQENPETSENQMPKDIKIFRAPNSIRESKKNFLDPSVISIGPLHYGDRRFSTMENIKWQSLHNFLSQDNGRDLKSYIDKMKELEKSARKCYGEVTNRISDDEFVKMMVVDGCFVLSYFSNERNSNFEAGWNSVFIDTDLLLLENQLPYFVLEELYNIRKNNLEDMKTVLPGYFAECLGQNVGNEDIPSRIHHLAHLHYHSIVPINPDLREPDSRSSVCHGVKDTIKCFLVGLLVLVAKIICCCANMSTKENSEMVIPCATELQEAGVQFRCRAKDSTRHMLDISFNNGVLEIPMIKTGDEFKAFFMNLLAFEQCNLHILNLQPHISSYARFLDSLVNSQKDVMILQKCGIIENLLSSEEELTSFFNQVSGDVKLTQDHLLAQLFIEVNRYCESSSNRQLAELKRDYFSSPWKALGFFAGVILLTLTFLQTFYAIYSYRHPH